MAEIEIKGYTILFDEEDREIIESHNWYMGAIRYGYPVLMAGIYRPKTNEKPKGHKYIGVLSRMVMRATDDDIVSFKTKNRFDYRKANLSMRSRDKTVYRTSENWTLNREEIIYAGALFDGEGCFSVSNVGCKAALTMTDFDSVKRFCDAVGMGYIKTLKQHKNYKQAYAWHVNGFEKVQAVYAMIYPWLNARRKARGAEILRPYIERQKTRNEHVNPQCLVIGCSVISIRRGLCDRHYRQRENWIKNKSPKCLWLSVKLESPLPMRKRRQYQLGPQ